MRLRTAEELIRIPRKGDAIIPSPRPLERYQGPPADAVAAGYRIAAFDRPAGLLLVTLHPPVVLSLARQVGAAFPYLDPTPLAPDEARRLEPSLAPDVAACRFEMGTPSLALEIRDGNTCSFFAS